jgi:general secretion pathway protein D
MISRRAFALAFVTLVLLPGAGIRAQLSPSSPSSSEKPVSLHHKHEAEKFYVEGAKAIEHNDIRVAEEAFSRAVKLDPQNQQYISALAVAHEHLVTLLVQEAGNAKITGHPDVARAKLAQALTLDPYNPIATQHIGELARDAVIVGEDPTAGFTAAPPIRLEPDTQKRTFHLRAASTELIRQVTSAYGIAPTLDATIKGRTVRFDVEDVSFEQAISLLTLVTKTFFVPLDPKRVLVADDSRDNRSKYERLFMETIYLPGLTPTEMSDMANIARTVFEAQQATVSADHGTMTVRAPQAKLAALNSTLLDLLKGHSEVQLDIRLYEIDKTKARNIGIQLPQQTTVFNVPTELNNIISQNQSLVDQIISSGLAAPGDFLAIAAILIASGQVSGTILNQPLALFGGGLSLTGISLGVGVTGNLSLNSSDVRALDQITMRALDQETSTIRSGTKYPIITSTYSSLSGNNLSIPGITSAGLSSALQGLGINAAALSSGATQNIPQVQYEDLGLTLKVTPRVQQTHDISLNLDMKIESLAGNAINNIPILANRQYTGILTLKQGESALIVSSLSRQQSAAVTGVPGLSELPGFQSTTDKQTTYDVSNLAILITPHLVRPSHDAPASRLVMLPSHP